MDTFANIVIDKLGGTGATAKLCETSPGAVSQWRKDGIPAARLMYLKLARPDVFGTDQIDIAPPANSSKQAA